ncbi:PAS domain-containing protein [Tabrizicola sp. TH137]|uniref:PAS domain-containing protein n=1 Tax=Tabrizicola sp. TH137 TaxID=2067452 RepID=UPI001C1F5CB7|nr:PAS domain-containing protein [Tabrizicola sp. TH137]
MPEEISVVRMLNELVRTPLPNLDQAVTRSIGRLAEVSGAGWACLFRMEDGHLRKRFSYMAPGLSPVTCDQDLLVQPFLPDLTANLPAYVADRTALPDDHPLKEVLACGALLALPINEDGRLTGVLAFVYATPRTDFGPLQIDRMKAAAEVLETVLARRETERRYLDTTRRLEATLAALPDLLFEVTADGRFAEFVAGPAHLMIAPPEALRGKSFAELLPQKVAKLVQGALEQALATGRVDGVRYRLDLPDGPHWFELTGAVKPSDTPDTQPSVIFLVRDVTADTRMRDELTQLGKIVESMSNLVCIIDLDENIVWCNAAFERQTGWTLEEVRGRYLGDIVRAPGIDPMNAEAVHDAIRLREAYSGTTINQDRWGNRYWIDFNVVPLHDAQGDLAGFVTIETVVTQLKEQEAAMAELARSATEARERLENAVRALPDAVIIVDDKERVVVANSAYHEMVPQLAPFAGEGASLESILRKGVELGVFGPCETEEEREAWVAKRMAAYRKPFDQDEIQLPDGRWMRRLHTRTSDGGIVAIAIDVTARHNQIAALDAANQELSAALAERDQAERNLRSIIDGAAVGTWEWDISADVLHVGGRWAEMLGRTAAEPGVFSLAEFRASVHPEDVTLLPNPFRTEMGTDDSFSEIEFRLRHDDGGWTWVLSRSQVTERAADGTPLRMAGVHLDISDRKRLERQLQTGRAYLSEVMDTSIAALAVLNERGAITYANQEAERILRLERSQLRGRAYNDPGWKLQRVDGSPLPDDELPFRLAMAQGGIVRDIRFAVHLADGTRRVLSANAVPLTPLDGGQQVVVSFSDITDELASTARLEEARSRAEEMSRAKSIFLANMSHEIRTPLNGVLGMAEVLDSIVEVPEQKQMVATIRRSGETLLTVLNSILDMSKIEAGKMVLEEVPMVLSDVLAQVEALHRVKAEEKGLELQVLTSAGADLPRMGDPHRLTQILNNLLSNAIKFTEQGRVRLKLSCKPGKPINIDVSDTGVGMTEIQLSRVFESFEQADGSMTRRFGGTGLGLSIVRQLVLLMGGMISLQSRPGEGTQVRVVIPLAEAAIGSVAGPEPDEAPDLTALNGRNLLIADDNVTNRMVLAEMLGQTGLRTTMVENGQEAVVAWERAQAQASPFDLLLLDITMPVMDGLRALAEIRDREGRGGVDPVPAIAVTANAMPNQVADYIMGGFDTHLAKPFKRKELLHAVKTLLRN